MYAIKNLKAFKKSASSKILFVKFVLLVKLPMNSSLYIHFRQKKKNETLVYLAGYNGSFTQMDDHGYLHANNQQTVRSSFFYMSIRFWKIKVYHESVLTG